MKKDCEACQILFELAYGMQEIGNDIALENTDKKKHLRMFAITEDGIMEFN